MALVPNHVAAFALANPGSTLTMDEQELLTDLSLYHLTIVEQFFMGVLNPSLNTEKLANASSYNLGATGMVRSDAVRETVSLSHLGLSYSEATINLHRDNMLGTTRSDSTRLKMYESHGGVAVYVLDQMTSEVTTFSTKSAAAIALNISLRTLSRWAEDPSRVPTVKNNPKYTNVRLSLSPL